MWFCRFDRSHVNPLILQAETGKPPWLPSRIAEACRNREVKLALDIRFLFA